MLSESSESHLGVAQLVARYLGVVEAAGSSPVTQTISSIHKGFDFMNARFFLICYYASGLLKTCFLTARFDAWGECATRAEKTFFEKFDRIYSDT